MSDDEQRTEDLIASGRLSWPLPPRSDVPPLSDTLLNTREAGDR